MRADAHDGLTRGTLLGGRVIHDQPATGFRSGIEPVLLAAFVPASPGDCVLEAGSGAGAALLCLSARIPGVGGVGVERDAALTRLAARNAAANGFRDVRFVTAALPPLPFRRRFHHAMANPPYHHAGSTASGNAARDAAKRMAPDLLAHWTGALADATRPGGSVTLIVGARALDGAVAAFARARLGGLVIFPIWPRADRAAKLVMLQGRVGGRGGSAIARGITLHADEGFTREADDVLRRGAAIAV